MESNIMDTLLTTAGKVIEFSGTCLTAMVENPIYAFYFACGLVPIGLGMVAHLKHTARS